LGLKTSLWIGNGYNFGLNIINYTDFRENTLKFRPEVGLGFGNIRMIYGYNFTILNKEFTGINTHNFTLNILFDVKELKKRK
jgi:hypothetical protein